MRIIELRVLINTEEDELKKKLGLDNDNEGEYKRHTINVNNIDSINMENYGDYTMMYISGEACVVLESPEEILELIKHHSKEI